MLIDSTVIVDVRHADDKTSVFPVGSSDAMIAVSLGRVFLVDTERSVGSRRIDGKTGHWLPEVRLLGCKPDKWLSTLLGVSKRGLMQRSPWP